MISRLRLQLSLHRNALLFMAALACGGIAVVAGRGYLDQQLAAERARLTPKPARTMDVVVARHDLGKGDVISAQTMALRRVPEEFVSSSVVRPAQLDSINGLRLATALRGGEQLVAAAIVGGDTLTFSHRVKPGIRALTIAVDEINSISGMLQPGDRIDLLFSARPPGEAAAGGQAPEATVPLFQSLLVLATGRQVRAGVDERGSPRNFSTVTVEVEPEHAQRLVVAQRAGKLTAVLRNPDDSQRMARKAMDIRQLLELPPAASGQGPGPQMIVGGLGRVPVYPSDRQDAGEPIDAGTTSAGPPSGAESVPRPASPGRAGKAFGAERAERAAQTEGAEVGGGPGRAGRVMGFEGREPEPPRRAR
jgi:pilus assembly protein CpaB